MKKISFILVFVILFTMLAPLNIFSASNVLNQYYFEDFSNADAASGTISSSASGWWSINSGSLVLDCESETKSSVNFPNKVFNIDRSVLEDGGGTVVVSYDIFVPYDTGVYREVVGYVNMLNSNGTTVQCISPMPGFVGVAKGYTRVRNGIVSTATQWAANGSSGEYTNIDTSAGVAEGGKTINVKSVITYDKTDEYYVTKYFVDHAPVSDGAGGLASYKVKGLENAADRSYINLMIYERNYKAGTDTEGVKIDNVCIYTAGQTVPLQGTIKNTLLTITFKNNGITSSDAPDAVSKGYIDSSTANQTKITDANGAVISGSSAIAVENELRITLPESLTAGDKIKVDLTGVKDIAGNQVSGDTNVYTIPETVQMGTANIENIKYFEDFENAASSLSEVGVPNGGQYDSDGDTVKDSDIFTLGTTDKNGKGLQVNYTGGAAYLPNGTNEYGFKLSYDAFENAGKNLECSVDVYIPSGTYSGLKATPFLGFADKDGNVIQIFSRMAQILPGGYNIVTGTSTRVSDAWGANAPSGDVVTKSLTNTTSGAWVNLKTQISYLRDVNGTGYYTSSYYIDNVPLKNSDGTPMTFKMQEKSENSDRVYMQFYLSAACPANYTERLMFDNFTIKVVDGETGLNMSNLALNGSTASFEFANYDTKAHNYQFIIAKHDEETDILLDVETISPGTMPARTSGSVTRTLDLSDTAYTYKAYVWDSMSNMRPLMPATKKTLSKIDSADWILAPLTYSGSNSVDEATDYRTYYFNDMRFVRDENGDSYAFGAAPLLRTEFTAATDKEIAAATVNVAGLGYYELYINGEKVGDKVLEPFLTLYDEDCVYYSSFDVTDLIANGENAVGAVLGRGSYATHIFGNIGMAAGKRGSEKGGRQRLKMTLTIEYDDGTVTEVPTSAGWKVAGSPIRYDLQAFGELYDARMEDELGWQTNTWATAGFDDSEWTSAELESTKDPQGTLVPAPENYNAVIETYSNLNVKALGNNTFRVDTGRVLTGWAQISGLNGTTDTEGRVIELHYIENLNTWDTGASDSQSTQQATFCYVDKDGVEQRIEDGYAQTDRYVIKNGENNWSPKFTLKSFRYIDVTFPEGMTVSAADVKEWISVEEVHVNVEKTGYFECSNELFNSTFDIAQNTLLNNMHSYISDTPLHENAPYLYDGVASAEWGMYSFDMKDYLNKWLRDMRATQNEDGKLGPIAPSVKLGLPAPEWSEAFPELVWALYMHTGDTAVISKNYDSVKKLFEWETSEEGRDDALSNATAELVTGSLPDYIYISKWGDHVPPSDIDGYVKKRFTTLNATAYVYREAVLLKQMAEVLGKNDDAAELDAFAENIKSAFNEYFWDADKGYYHDAKVMKEQSGEYYGTSEFRQTPQIIAIKFGLVEEENKAGLLEKLKASVDEFQKDGYSGFATGLSGTKYIFDAMTENGYGEEVYEIFNTDVYPGYGYWLKKGATSMWEYWETDGRSDNHHMFGVIVKWFYRHLAGIQEATAGYKRSIIKPIVPGDLSYASAGIETPYGMLESEWTKAEDGGITLNINIPSGTTATVYVPLGNNTAVEAPAAASRLSIEENGYEVYSVAAGKHTFVAK